ncbi:zinc-finger-containing protein [Anaerotignum sp.]|uniref:zinc-finger-containing protein n=1 Tax=Anaerotignum sp. TaxID=2039241 RepID=UPI0028A6FD45|nr:zinc-finger-containing protein [Anaerotignum sp.]
MKQVKIRCPYCGAHAVLRPSTAVYQDKARPGRYVYVCARYPLCDSYVGAHKGTLLPMGTLANGDLRNKRIQAHRAFNRLWESGAMKKWQAYQWMQAKFGLCSKQAHIAMFSTYMCDKLISECDKVAANMKLTA